MSFVLRYLEDCRLAPSTIAHSSLDDTSNSVFYFILASNYRDGSNIAYRSVCTSYATKMDGSAARSTSEPVYALLRSTTAVPQVLLRTITWSLLSTIISIAMLKTVWWYRKPGRKLRHADRNAMKCCIFDMAFWIGVAINLSNNYTIQQSLNRLDLVGGWQIL